MKWPIFSKILWLFSWFWWIFLWLSDAIHRKKCPTKVAFFTILGRVKYRIFKASGVFSHAPPPRLCTRPAGGHTAPHGTPAVFDIKTCRRFPARKFLDRTQLLKVVYAALIFNKCKIIARHIVLICSSLAE